jgi:NADPH:quinone reductase-like Zn-dependent oxidoreductase
MTTTTTPMSVPATYRAVTYASVSGGFNKNLQINTLPLPPVPKSGAFAKPCVLVKTHAASLNPADYKLPIGPLGPLLIKKPATPGLDFTGTIVAFPKDSSAEKLGLDGLKVGDKVIARLDFPYQMGALGEYVYAQPNGLAKLPDGVDFTNAAGIGTASITAWQSLKPYIRAGDKVFINGGSGGVGLYAIQIAKLLGASHVTVTCSGQNAELVKEFGADEVIDYKSVDVVTELKKQAEAKEFKYDLVVDNVAEINQIYEESHHYLREGGTNVRVAVKVDSLYEFYILLKQLLLPGFLGGGKRKYAFLLAKNDLAGMKQISTWISEGKLKMLNDSEYDFENVQSAFARLETGRARGKVIVKIEE